MCGKYARSTNLHVAYVYRCVGYRAQTAGDWALCSRKITACRTTLRLSGSERKTSRFVNLPPHTRVSHISAKIATIPNSKLHAAKQRIWRITLPTTFLQTREIVQDYFCIQSKGLTNFFVHLTSHDSTLRTCSGICKCMISGLSVYSTLAHLFSVSILHFDQIPQSFHILNT